MPRKQEASGGPRKTITMKLTRVAVVIAIVMAMMPWARADYGALCSWYLKTDADTLNIAYPDQSATYWSTEFYSIPVARVVIHGTYPFARYFSFHAYDAATRTVGSLADYQIDPDPGSDNPFRTASAGNDPAHRRYTVTVVFTAKPSTPLPNTLYAGATADGAPNATGALIYRLYVPDDPNSEAGGVGLPDVSIASDAGETALPQCTPLPPSTGGQLNQYERESSFPNDVPRAIPLGNQWTNPPTTKRFYGLDRLAWDRVPPNQITNSVPRFKGTFYSNDQNAYLITRTSRQFGDIVVYRAKAPTFPDTRAGTPVSSAAQLRYWSLCEYELATERYIECSADYQSVIGADGRFTFVISDAEDRPSNATRANGVNWLPWGGPYYEGFIGYRQMIPAQGFGQAVQHIAEGTDGATVMGEYWPQVAYCARATIESGGPDACFSP